MLNSFVLKVAIRYFSAKKEEKLVSIISAFSFLGVMIGVAALIIVMSVMNGFHIELVKNIRGLNGDITITAIDKPITDYQKIKKTVIDNFAVIKIAPEIYGQSLAVGKIANSGAIIRGTNLTDLKNKGQITKNILDGSFVEFYGKDVIAIGSELSLILGVKVGDRVKLISPNSISTAFGSMPRSKDFRVVAIFSSGVYDYDAATIIMPLEAAQNFMSLGEAINLIEITINHPDNAHVITNTLQEILKKDDVRVTSWQMSNASFLNALRVERTAMFTILSLIILVAAFNIISSLFMIVNNKTKDIAILRTMGASRLQIMLIFICNGTIIGVIGTLLGVLLGTSFAYNIDNIKNYLENISGLKLFDAALYYLYSLPSEVELNDIIFVASMSIVLCCLATIYPAYKAAKINPISSLKYE